MATAEQIKSLIRSHVSGDLERFSTIALQVAAHEAQQGHAALAQDIRTLLDKDRRKKASTPLSFPVDLRGLVLTAAAETPKAAVVVPSTLCARIGRVIHEYRHQSTLKSHGLKHRRKLLLIGPPGTGKTMTAHVVATELHLPLSLVQMDRMVTRFLGETSAKLRQIFALIQQEHGVYLFDEFDAIGGARSMDNDVGEMRRVVNTFLQCIEQDTSDSVIVAATNHPTLLDHALFRRFDDVLHYEIPPWEDRKRVIEHVLGTFLATGFVWEQVLHTSAGLSHAEIDHACRDAIKHMILSDQTTVTATQVLQVLQERQGAQKGGRGS
jgi:AAA+ superfamily predicted ATPase